MKDLRLLFLAAAAAFVLIVATGCTDNATTPAVDPMDLLYTQPSSTTDLVLPVDVVDATLDADMTMVADQYTLDQQAYGVQGDDRHPDDRGGRGRFPKPFDRLLHALQLTPEQADQVKELLQKHHDCVGEAMSVLREHVKTILDGANVARHEVLDKLRAGEITRDEARTAIREINARARQALKDSNIIARVREMLKACDQEFIEGLKTILTPEQLEILQRWIDHRDGGNPGGPGTGRRG